MASILGGSGRIFHRNINLNRIRPHISKADKHKSNKQNPPDAGLLLRIFAKTIRDVADDDNECPGLHSDSFGDGPGRNHIWVLRGQDQGQDIWE